MGAKKHIVSLVWSPELSEGVTIMQSGPLREHCGRVPLGDAHLEGAQMVPRGRCPRCAQPSDVFWKVRLALATE